MKLNKRSRWIIVVTVLAVLSVLLFIPANSVRAIFDGAHVVDIFLRVQTEILQKTPAGRYYEALFFKHVVEIDQIMYAYPEHAKDFLPAALIFVPELEALLDGNGDKVYITSEHVKSLKSELDWFASKASPALQEDIQRESQHLPLNHIVGMTMSEAWDFINSRWTPDMVIQQTLVPISPVQTSIPYSAIQMATWAPQQTLVPNSDGKWASYVHNDVYLEYPSSYYLLAPKFENDDYIYFAPSTNTPKAWNTFEIGVGIWNIPLNEKELKNPRGFYSPESILWENVISDAEFEGFEFIANRMNQKPPIIWDFHSFQYNQDNQLVVHISVTVSCDITMRQCQLDDFLSYSEMINRRYEYFQHMVDSLQIQTP